MSTTKSIIKKITSLFLSLVFVITSFAVVDFSQSAAIEAKADAEEYFLMAYFTGNYLTEQQIRLAVSTDGFNFKPLNGGDPILTEKSSDTHSYTDPGNNTYRYTEGVRDPYIFKGGDGYYYCIATDLDDIQYGWWGNQPQMVMWRSLDLVNWSDAKYINIAQIVNEKTGTTYNNDNFARVWAPEVYYEAGTYYIHFAIGANSGYNSTTMYYMSTDDMWDLSHYNVPQQLYRPADDSSHPTQTGDAIDATIVKQDGVYYMIYKDENAGNAVLVKGNSPTGPYHYVGKLDTASDGAGAVEGNEIYTVGNNYYFVADRYSANGKFAVYNLGTDLSAITASDGVINMTNGSPISRVSLTGYENLTPRHGSFLHITAEEYNRLTSYYGGVTNDDIMYNFTTEFTQDGGWNYRSFQDSSLRWIDFMTQSGGYSSVIHDSGYATVKNANMFVNDSDVRNMFPDDIYTISFDYSLENDSALGAPIIALGDNSPTDYVMIFGNGDMYVRKSGENTDTWVANKPLTVGVAYHYDIVSDGTNITFYRDGNQIGQITATVDFPTAEQREVRYVALGKSDAHTTNGYGSYAHLRFRNSAVSAAQLSLEFEDKLLYRNDTGSETINGMHNALDVSYTGYHNLKEPIASTVSASYSIASWVNPGDSVNGHAMLAIGNDRWTPSPYGRYFVINENGDAHFNCCSGSGNYSEHFVDISGLFGSGLSANTWSYIQINIVPVNTNQVKLSAWVNGVSTYSSDITLTTKVDGNNTTGNDYLYGMLGAMQMNTNYMYIGANTCPGWWTTNIAENTETTYVKDVRVYAQAMDPSLLYSEATDIRDAAVARDYVRANLESYDVTASANKANRAGYYYGRTATGGYNNVLACSTSTVCADNYSGVSNVNYKFFWPADIAVMYDGVNTPAIPVALETIRNGDSKEIYTIYSKTSEWQNAHYWTGYVDGSEDGLDRWISWPGNHHPYNHADGITNESGSAYTAVTTDGYAHIGFGDGTKYDYSYWVNNSSTPRHFWNKVNYVGTSNTSSYKDTYTSVDYWVYNKSNNNNSSIGSVSHNMYVVNYKPIYDILRYDDNNALSGTTVPGSSYNLKALYTLFVKDHEDNYTEDSLNQFYLAAYKVLTCNPVEYSEATYQGDFSGTVTLAANEIKDAMDAFNAINLKQRASFTALDNARASANTVIDTLGTNSQVKTTTSINNLKQVVDGLYYAPDDGTPYRPNLDAATYQDLIDTETSSVNAKITALDDIYDFDTYYTELPVPYIDGEQRSYNEIYADALEVIGTKGTASQVYTTDTIQHLESVVAALNYMPASKVDLKDVGYNKDRIAIGDEVDVLLDALTVEDEYDIVGINGLHYNCVSELAALEEKYNQGDAKLKAISEDAPLYTKSSVDNLITAVDTAKTNAATTVAQRRNTDALTSKSTIEAQTSNINTYISSLESSKPASVTDLSAYRAAISKVQDIDPDIYDTTKFNEYSVDLCAAYVSGSDSTYTDASSDSYTIKTIADSKTQTDVDNATSATLGYLTTNLKTYTITLDANGRYSTERDAVTAEAPGRVDGSGRSWTGYANTRAVITAADANTAWYMSYTSGSGTRRTRQYQGYGESITLSVLGNMSIEAVQETENKPNKVTINRYYSDNSSSHGVSSIDYAGSTYTLPAAPALAYYRFDGYSFGGNTYYPDDTITVTSKNTVVNAIYTKVVDNEYTVKVSTTSGNGDVFGGKGGQSAAYNTKIEASDPYAYAWVERPDGASERIFSIGSNLTFFVTDSSEVYAITKAEYDAAGYVVPKVNLRSSGVVISDAADDKHKLTFNGQVVHNNSYIVECGILVGKAKAGGAITNEDMVLANTAANDDYKILRAKSTKTVGANQFTIGVTTNITGEFKYRGYAVYQVGSDIITVYSDVVDATVS